MDYPKVLLRLFPERRQKEGHITGEYIFSTLHWVIDKKEIMSFWREM